MLVICEDCAKKYEIDETKIQRDKAQFACKECGHIIVVEKPKNVDSVIDSANTMSSSEETETVIEQSSVSAPAPVAGRSAGKGTPVRAYILVTMLLGFLLVSAAFAYLYLTFIPSIINHQIDLRTQAVSTAFSGAVKKPLILRNYLQVNKEAKRISKIPGIAYTAVVNAKGKVIAGFFNDINKFDSQFVQDVKKAGFPKQIIEQNPLTSGVSHNARFTIGGQEIVDEVSLISDTGSTVHVGVHVAEVNDAIRNALMSPITLSILAALLFIGLLMAIFLSSLIAKPMSELTDVANRISFGQLDLEIPSKGPREMRELATAFDRMRVSIKAALDRLRK